MRTAALAVTILIVLVMFFGPAGFIVGVAVVAAVPLLRRSERRARVIAAAWLVGGALLAVGWIQLAWRHELAGAFAWIAAAGGILVAVGFIFLPVIARGRAGVLVAGLVVTAFAWASAFVGGLFLLPLGVLLYAIGAVRARLVRPADAAFAVASLALAALLGWRAAHDLLVAELASAAALAIGAALARSTGLADLTRPQRVE